MTLFYLNITLKMVQFYNHYEKKYKLKKLNALERQLLHHNKSTIEAQAAGVQLVLDWLLIVHDVIVRQNNSILLNNWNIWSSTVNYDSEEKRMTCWIKLLFELVRVFEITIFVNYEPRTIQINSQKSTSKNNEFSQKLLRKNSAIRRNFNSGVHIQIYM